MDVLGYALYTFNDWYRSKTKQTVYSPQDILTQRLAEMRIKLLKQNNIDGYKVNFNMTTDVLGLYNEIFCFKCYDFKTNKIIPRIIDGGANIGMASLRFKKLYPHALITAFEPQPNIFEMLKHNISDNGFTDSITPINAAISDFDGTTSFNVTTNGVTDCCASLADTPGMNNKIDVNVTRLSPYINEQVDLLKLDIEGSEYPVLDDLDKTRKLDLVDRIAIEYHPIRRKKDDKEKFRSRINEDKEEYNGYILPLLELLKRNGFYFDIRVPHEMDGETYLYTYIDGFSFFMIYAARRLEDIQRMGGYALIDKQRLEHWPAW